MVNAISIKTKLGWVSAYENNGKIFKIRFGKIRKQIPSNVLNKLKKNFTKNVIPNKKLPFIVRGNKTQKKVWSELRKIKSGQTKTYGQIAKKLKISPRHVGKICGQNKLPLYIPCHRVIRSDGALGGFTAIGGIKLKKKILMFESKKIDR